MLDPRGPRFAAALTTVVFVLVLVFSSGWLALAQAVVFGLTALAPKYGPYGLIYKSLVAPRLGKPTELEPQEPVRFAQALGLYSRSSPLRVTFSAPRLWVLLERPSRSARPSSTQRSGSASDARSTWRTAVSSAAAPELPALPPRRGPHDPRIMCPEFRSAGAPK